MQIDELIRDYPPVTRGLGALVLREYPRIVAARAHGWRWAEIAASLDLADGRALAAAYRRVRKKVEDGRLTPPSAGKPLSERKAISGFDKPKPANPIFDDD